MSEAITAARVHAFIKRRIIENAWPPAYALNLREIAEISGTSVLPVRDALQRLVGEGLVETRASGGFCTPIFSAGDIGHLYAWHGDLIALVLRACGDVATASAPHCDGNEADRSEIADRAANFFSTLATASPNPEHLQAIRAAGERLHPVRLCEHMVLKPQAELSTLEAALATAPRVRLRRMVEAYHRRRVRCAQALAVAVQTRGTRALMGASEAGTYKIGYTPDRL